MAGIYTASNHVANHTFEAMTCLLFYQRLRHFELVCFKKLAHYIIAYSMISFRSRTLVQVFTNLFTKSGEGIKFVPQTLCPFVIDLWQFLSTQCGDLRPIFNLPSIQTFRLEILRVL